ncbi:MAG: thiamine pyrophosphate-binding protein, partial [Pseudomonadota bacterium]
MTGGGNQLTGAEAMVRMLEAHKVDTVFGLCGDTTLPFYDALYRIGQNIRHILTRDERSAGYMADAYARVTGKVGVCEGPSGGGATYILPGVVEANESSIPILAINSDVSTGSIGKYPLTELDQNSLFRPLTKWNGVIPQASMLPGMVRTAFRGMTTGRPGAAHLGLPFDVQKDPVDDSEIWAQEELGRFPAWPTAPAASVVEDTVRALLEARRPLIVCGGGVVNSGGEAELDRLASRLDLTVATTISGQGSLADTHPNCLGVVGSNGGTPPTRAMVDEADLIIFIACRAGSVTTERWRSPAPGTAKIIHIDSDPMVISAVYQTDIAMVADARLALAAINEALDDHAGELPNFGAVAAIQKAKAEKFADFDPLAASDQSPILPERVTRTLNDLLPDDAVVVADPGTPCPYISGFFRQAKSGRHFITNRAHGALGYSMSASVGAQVGRPNAKVVAVMGDGSFGFTAGEFETVTRLGLPITFVVFSNSVFGWIKAGQKSGFGERYYGVDF